MFSLIYSCEQQFSLSEALQSFQTSCSGKCAFVEGIVDNHVRTSPEEEISDLVATALYSLCVHRNYIMDKITENIAQLSAPERGSIYI